MQMQPFMMLVVLQLLLVQFNYYSFHFLIIMEVIINFAFSHQCYLNNSTCTFTGIILVASITFVISISVQSKR